MCIGAYGVSAHGTQGHPAHCPAGTSKNVSGRRQMVAGDPTVPGGEPLLRAPEVPGLTLAEVTSGAHSPRKQDNRSTLPDYDELRPQLPSPGRLQTALNSAVHTFLTYILLKSPKREPLQGHSAEGLFPCGGEGGKVSILQMILKSYKNPKSLSVLSATPRPAVTVGDRTREPVPPRTQTPSPPRLTEISVGRSQRLFLSTRPADKESNALPAMESKCIKALSGPF